MTWLMRFLAREFFAELDLEKKSILTATCWGAWIISFDTLHSSPAYHYLIAAVAWVTGDAHAAWPWGLTMISVGALQFHGMRTDWRRLRMAAAIFATTMWLALGIAFALYNPVGAAPILYGLFALSNAALYYQVGIGARVRGGRLLRIAPTEGGVE